MKHDLLTSFGQQGTYEGTDIASVDAKVESIKTLCPEKMQPRIKQWWDESRPSIEKLQDVVSQDPDYHKRPSIEELQDVVSEDPDYHKLHENINNPFLIMLPY